MTVTPVPFVAGGAAPGAGRPARRQRKQVKGKGAAEPARHQTTQRKRLRNETVKHHVFQIFIDRPIFATVISLLLVLAGLAALRVLPVSRYPRLRRRW